ncbi:hypothetical protein AAZX31_13G324400 [Glycine max]|nr:beta-glucosidase 13 [Glycine max]KAG4384794.1 hypothetical protein GLYMA_13G343000v4 [Glycine max]KAG4972427.1 hypothetical protein JHK85_038848 [Glycine max]KAG4978815.1 hypothetical protein JHK86_038289 [Glycine max]KAG5114831.1 hypothetical protein JHK82_038100 [Glycine max]KAG5132112.1 hypothetical protein JHK84_038509 [Glycine max]|eukprot:XP_006595054.1 beta-glucosidase 13 [Glycine max]
MASLACNTFIVSSTLRSVVTRAEPPKPGPLFDLSSFNRHSFPAGFTFGASSSAYQFEGAAKEYGRGPSIWDTFINQHPGKIADGTNGDRALDQYHRYKEDVQIMKGMNLDAYRFSISWSRILPNGKLSGGINREGINYYNNLIHELQTKGLKPFVTLFHWDLPQALENEYKGFLSESIIDDFGDYAKFCFEEFGDRVKHWITFNEPHIFSSHGYAYGTKAPGRKSQGLRPDSGGTEPYRVSHNILLAHAKAVQLYRNSYKESQNGEIGITLDSRWFVPYSDASSDIEATERALDFEIGWFMEPLTSGKYPESMQLYVGRRLPEFSKEEAELVRGSFDFIGLNYYTTNTARVATGYTDSVHHHPDLSTDPNVELGLTRLNGSSPIGPVPGLGWLCVYPKGIRELLLRIKNLYNNPLIYITENGINELDDPTLSPEESLMDFYRIDYHYRHLLNVDYAIRDGVRVKGYFVWSLLDCFEWSNGYIPRFGLIFVDHKNNLNRSPKLSAKWFRKFLQNRLL